MSQPIPTPLDPPASQTTTKVINNFTVNVRNIILKTSADLEIAMFNDSNMVDFRVITISGEDYTNWGTDDNYIINWTANWIRQNYQSAQC